MPLGIQIHFDCCDKRANNGKTNLQLTIITYQKFNKKIMAYHPVNSEQKMKWLCK
jgi:hypothetical protein